MAKTLIVHDTDPRIGMLMETVPAGTPGRARGTHGTCTDCGYTIHRWDKLIALADAQRHVDGHEAVEVGGDLDSLVR